MTTRSRFFCIAVCGMVFAMVSQTEGQVSEIPVSKDQLSEGRVFLAEPFIYDPGSLTSTSGGQWVGHDGFPPDIVVENCRAILVSPGSMDDSRFLGAIMQPDDVWFYGLDFSVRTDEGTSVLPDYFVHLKDSLQGFCACLKIEAPVDSSKDFGLSILASSRVLTGTRWQGDFEFGQKIMAVVRWDNAAGEATLWVNPFDGDSSPTVSHSDPDSAARAIDSLALRQADGPIGTSSRITINEVAAGEDFFSVFAFVSVEPFIQFGDINQDCRVNLLDVDPLIDLLIEGQYDPVADMNFDGVVDLEDVPIFVELLLSL